MRGEWRARVSGAERRPVVRVEKLSLDRLSEEARRKLVDDCHRVYLKTSETLERTSFEAACFPPGLSCLVRLYFGAAGELAGWSSFAVRVFPVRGELHAVISAPVFFCPNYRGGADAARDGLLDAVVYKLRHPTARLGFVSSCTNPAPYKLFFRRLSRVYPNRHGATPEHIEEVIRAMGKARGMVTVEGDPWRHKSLGRPKAAEALKEAASLRDDPDAAFYVQRNPGYADADATALLVYMPLDLADIARGFARAAREKLGGRRGSRDARPAGAHGRDP